MLAYWSAVLACSARLNDARLAVVVAISLYACAPQSPSHQVPALQSAPAVSAPAAETLAPSSTSASLASVARYEDVPCWFRVHSRRDIDCGELTVPENWSKPGSKLIHLPVVIFRATTKPAEPIVFVNGGPGGPSHIRTAGEIESWLNLLWNQRWTHRRDFIVMAQRGTNWNDSNLSCPALTQLWRLGHLGPSNPSWQEKARLATVACARELAREHDLSAYNTPQSARDLAALRAALDIEAWSVYAVSYGTRFALSLMKNHPSGLRTVVLDSVYPPGITDPLGFAPGTVSANLTAVLDACALDAACRLIYHDLEPSFEAAIERLRAAPLSLPGQLRRDGYGFGPSALVETLFGLMHSSRAAGLIPEVIHGFAEYSDTYLSEWMSALLAESTAKENGADAILEGAFLAIRCNDDERPADPDWWTRAAVTYPPFREWILEHQQAAPCMHWPAAPSPVEETQRVVSAIPTLLLAGALDPATPFVYAELAAATLAHAYLVRFPATGHGILGSGPCASTIVGAFLDDPITRPSAACADAARSVDFSPSFQMHAVGLMSRGNPAEAEQLLWRTLAYQEERLSPDDPGIGMSLSILGESYYEQGRFSEAEHVLVRALAINAKVFGPDSLEASKSAGRLALVYHYQGRVEQAAALYRRTLRILEREYGPTHAEVDFYRDSYDKLLSKSFAHKRPGTPNDRPKTLPNLLRSP